MIDVSGYKSAQQCLNAIQSDETNIYSIAFFNRNNSNLELNRQLLLKLKAVADAKALKVTDPEIQYLFFAKVDLGIEGNQKLWEKFGLTSNSCDLYPAVAVVKNAKGTIIVGPAVVSLFEEQLDKLSGLTVTPAARSTASATTR